jgi:hypothetical protein
MTIQASELTAVVLQKINDFVPDALERETKLTSILTGEGKHQQKGGLYIQCPIKLIANTSQGFISGTGSLLDMTPAQQLQYMVFNWKYFNFNVNFTLADYNIATGASEIVDFMETKIEGALADAVRTWSTAFNGTNATDTLNFSGIKDVNAASGTAYGALTDTDYATGAFLGLYYDATSHFSQLTYANFNKMATDLRLRVKGYGKGKEIMATCNGLQYSKLKTALQNQQIFINESDFIKAGFVGFEVDGVKVYPDADAPGTGTAGTADNWLTMFPVDIMKFWYHYGFGTKSPFDGEVRIPNQTVQSYQNFVTGDLVCTNRRLMAVAKELA